MTIRLRRSLRAFVVAAGVAGICSLSLPAAVAPIGDIERSIHAADTHLAPVSRPSYKLAGIDRRQGGSVAPRWTPIAVSETSATGRLDEHYRAPVVEARPASIVRPRRLAFPYDATAPPISL